MMAATALLHASLLLLALHLAPSHIQAAWYSGQSAADAGRLLDTSEGQVGFTFHNPAHPRGHAPPGVAQYSRRDRKTAFLSHHDQDRVVHAVLGNRRAQEAMAKMNRGSLSEVLNMPAVDMPASARVKVQQWTDGQPSGQPGPMRRAVLVLYHRRDSRGNRAPDSWPPLVQTAYGAL